MAFLVYRSSAGSGKTFTLVRQFLNIALSHPLPDNYRSVLAITFTNKAASEMKERVLGTLAGIAGGSDSRNIKTISKILCDDLVIDSVELQKRAATVLKHMLHNYSDLNISTIDKFTHRIIRSFAFDLRVPLNFEIELDEKQLVSETTDLILEKVGLDPLLTKVLSEFSMSRADDDASWDIERAIRKFGSMLMHEKTYDVLDAGLLPSPAEAMEIRNRLRKMVQQTEGELKRIGSNALALISKAGVKPDELAGGKNGIGGYFQNLAQLNKFIPNPTTIKNVEANKWSGSKAKGSEKLIMEGLGPDLTKLFNDAQKLIPDYFLNKILLKNIYGTALLGELSQCRNEVKESRNILPISEFNRILIQIVRREPAPFIYERIGEKYRHFLIDEFQDTSSMQWHNLLPLLENGLSSGYLSMVVGDAKQSIYRWRGGDSTQFLDLPNVLSVASDELTPLRQEVLESHYQEAKLNTNYRSDPTIVSFNNDFFDAIKSSIPEQSRKVYHDHSQEFRLGDEGFINIEFVGNKEMKVAEIKDCNIEKVCVQVDELRARGLSFSDIAILSRNNKDGSDLATCLTDRGIPVISQESLLLGSSLKVRLVIALMRWLDQPHSTEYRTSILTILALSKKIKGETKWASVHDETAFSDLLSRSGIYIKQNLLRQLELYDQTEELIRSCGLGEQGDPFLTELLDVVHKYSEKVNENLSSFLKWWDEKGSATGIAVPEGIDAVRILSIHRAKGLEFPVVILPFANWYAQDTQEPFWIRYKDADFDKCLLLNFSKAMIDAGLHEIYENEIQKSLLDDLNLLYVAFTRPIHELYIITSLPAREKSVSNFICDFLRSKGIFNEGESTYEFGKKMQVKRSAEQRQLPQYSFQSSYWPEHIKISYTAPEEWDVSNPDKEASHGTLLHRLFSMCINLDEALPMVQHISCSDSARKWLGEKVSAISEVSGFRELFQGKKVLMEREIISKDGDTYRPDRVVIRDGQVTVIDFKTGMKNTKHKEQINAYGTLLEEMGYEKVSRYLVYISTPEIIEVKN